MFTTYEPYVISHLGGASPLIIDVAFDLAGLEGTMGVTIEVDQTVTTSNNVVQFVIFEDHVLTEVNLAREVLTSEVFTLTTPGQTVSYNRNFTLESHWAVENIGVLVFVQSESGTKPVLQAALGVADYSGLINVDAEPEGLDAPWVLEGPNGFLQVRTNDATMPVFAAGEYTITWGDVVGWTSPSPAQETLILVEDGEITFTGVFTGGPFAAKTDGDLGNPTSSDQSAAMRDYDGDGDLDIAVGCMSAPDLLLSNGPVNAFSAVSVALLSANDPTTSLVWGDMDNDGHPDLYASREGAANALLRSDGVGGFVDVTFGDTGDTGTASGAVWVDYNEDGLLDLYVVNTGSADKRLRNYGLLGGMYFFLTEGLSAAGDGKSASWVDYNNDGDQDYYLVNSLEANILYNYDGVSAYWEEAIPDYMSDVGNGAGAVWGDYDNDGDFDLYFTNDGSLDRLIRQTASGWSMVIGGALEDPGHGRGVSWGDLDNDGDLDLFIARHGEYDRYLRNDDGVFVNIPLGIDETAGHANGCALGDTDGDGDLDVYVVNDGESNVLLVNQLDNGNHWLHLDLVGDDCNRDAVGARVRLVTGIDSQIREINGGSGFRSQNSPTVEFGLGAVAMADSIIINWPCGNVEIFTDVAADQKLTYVENEETGSPLIPQAGILSLRPASPNPFNPQTRVSFDLPRAGRATLRVYDVSGRLVRTLVDDDLPAGEHFVTWSGDDDTGRGVATGTYLLRVMQSGISKVQRVTLMK
jgi:enediyne biosynthesis protein E4